MDKAQVSHTAWLVFACHLRLKQMARWAALVSDEDALFYQKCYAYCRRNFPRYRFLHYLLPLKPCIALVDKALAFGAPQHFVLRKRAIAAHVEAALHAGAAQVIILGGGFDTAAFKNAKRFVNVEFFEIDMPAMHGHKTALVKEHIGALPGNLHFVSADLSQEKLSQVLSAQVEFSANVASVFVVEGVLMYLPEEAVRTLFTEIAALCTGGISIIFTAIEARRESRAAKDKKLRNAILKASKERFSWSMDAGHMKEFLTALGWQQTQLLSYADLQRPHRSPAEMQKIETQHGEYLVAATRAGQA